MTFLQERYPDNRLTYRNLTNKPSTPFYPRRDGQRVAADGSEVTSASIGSRVGIQRWFRQTSLAPLGDRVRRGRPELSIIARLEGSSGHQPAEAPLEVNKKRAVCKTGKNSAHSFLRPVSAQVVDKSRKKAFIIISLFSQPTITAATTTAIIVATATPWDHLPFAMSKIDCLSLSRCL